MTRISETQLPPFSNEEQFEDFCVDLYSRKYSSGFQRNGRRGQRQAGVDLFGNSGETRVGVQCKKKALEDELTETEIRDEVSKALGFKPPLTTYVFATTCKRDTKAQEVARQISEEHKGRGLFSVRVDSWDDIKLVLDDHPEVVSKYFSCYLISTAPKSETSLSQLGQAAILDKGDEKVGSKQEVIVIQQSSTPQSEYHADLDHSKKLLNENKPKTALDYLEGLRNRIWHEASSKIKYRILTNLASAHIQLKDQKKAAGLYLEALTYDRDSSDAHLNAACGYMLLENFPEAKKHAEKSLELNSENYKAYVTLVQIQQPNSLEQAKCIIPTRFHDKLSIAHTFSFLARKLELQEEALYWAKAAYEAEGGSKDMDVVADYATVIMTEVTTSQEIRLTRKAPEHLLPRLQEAVSLFDAAISMLETSEISKERCYWYVNRGTAKMFLGRQDEARADLEKAFSQAASDFEVCKHLAMVCIQEGSGDRAIEVLESFQVKEYHPQIGLLLAEASVKAQKIEKALEELDRVIACETCPRELVKEARRFKAQIGIQTGNLKIAEQEAGALRSSDSADIEALVLSSKVERENGNGSLADELLAEAVNCITLDSPPLHKLDLADELYSSSNFEMAAGIYSQLVGGSTSHPAVYRLANSLFKVGRFQELITLCEALIKSRNDTYPFELLAGVYEELGDLEKAKEVCKTGITKHPRSAALRLRLAMNCFRTEDFFQTDSLLNEKFDEKELSISNSALLAQLLAERGRLKDAVSLMYGVRKRHWNELDAHMRYMGLFLGHPDREGGFVTNFVGLDAFVELELSDGTKVEFTVEEPSSNPPQKGERSPSDTLVKLVWGKATGFTFDMPSGFTKVTGKVVRLKNKYVHAFQESMNSVGSMFPDKPTISKVPAIVDSTRAISPEFERLLPDLEEGKSIHDQALDLYLKRLATLGSVAQILKKSPIEVYDFLTGTTTPGLVCSLGNPEERANANGFSAQAKVILDITAIMSVARLDLFAMTEEKIPNRYVTQSTVDLFQAMIAERKLHEKDGYLFLAREGGRVVRHVVPAEAVQANIAFLQKIKKWLLEKCKIAPVPADYPIQRDRKEQLEDLFGEDALSTILVATQQEYFLWSDDERLRFVSGGEFKTKGVWTKFILEHLLEAQLISKEEHDEITIGLLERNYSFISVNADILLKAAKKAEFKPRPPFSSAAAALGGRVNFDSAMEVAARFAIDLWRQPISINARDNMLGHLLAAITRDRNLAVTVKALQGVVGRRLVLSPIEAKRIIDTIETWALARRKTHLR